MAWQATPTSRALVVNVLVLGAVFVMLAVSPAPVSFPESAWETMLLIAGAVALLLVNALAIPAPGDSRLVPVIAHEPPGDRAFDLFSACVDYKVVDEATRSGSWTRSSRRARAELSGSL